MPVRMGETKQFSFAVPMPDSLIQVFSKNTEAQDEK